MKRITLGVVLISAALLSGCIIVPHRHGGYRGGDRHHYSDSHDRSPVYVQPGRRY